MRFIPLLAVLFACDIVAAAETALDKAKAFELERADAVFRAAIDEFKEELATLRSEWPPLENAKVIVGSKKEKTPKGELIFPSKKAKAAACREVVNKVALHVSNFPNFSEGKYPIAKAVSAGLAGLRVPKVAGDQWWGLTKIGMVSNTHFSIIQVAGDSSAIVKESTNPRGDSFWLTGIDTSEMVEDQQIYVGPVYVSGTKTYESVGAGTRKVFQLEPVPKGFLEPLRALSDEDRKTVANAKDEATAFHAKIKRFVDALAP